MSWIHYLLEANLYLVTFYALYYLIFRGETYYQLNRIYLLASTLMAFSIPVIQVGILNPAATQVQNFVTVTTNIPVTGMPVKVITADPSWPLINYFILIYAIIVLLLLINFMIKIYKLMRLSHINKATEKEGFKLVELNGQNNAFSFFNYLFISPGLTLSPTIIHHELIHIRQRHSWDIIYLELLKILNWFNPVIYLLQNSMKEVHEFIADSKTAGNDEGAEIYTDFLVNSAYGINENTLTNTFFNKSLLKKRIMMLHQKKSGNAARLKYLLILPLMCGLLCVSTLTFSKTYALVDLAPRHEFIVSAKHNKILYDTLKYRSKSIAVTLKGYKYKETGYLVNKKVNFRVIITEKDGWQKAYYRNSATTAQLDLLKDKYGYTFPTMDIFDRMPPPPPVGPKGLSAPGPAAPASKIAPPPPPVPPVKVAPPKGAVKFPPPGYWDNSSEKLGDYIKHHLHYPLDAKNNNIHGNTVAQFTVSNDHKITDVKIINSIGQVCDDEVVRTLKSFNGTVDKGAGDYMFAVSFNLIGDSKKNTTIPKPIDPELSGKANFVGLIQTYAYIK